MAGSWQVIFGFNYSRAERRNYFAERDNFVPATTFNYILNKADIFAFQCDLKVPLLAALHLF